MKETVINIKLTNFLETKRKGRVVATYLLSALAKRTASSSGLGVSSAKSAATLHIQALSLSQLGSNFIDGATVSKTRTLTNHVHSIYQKSYCNDWHKSSTFCPASSILGRCFSGGGRALWFHRSPVLSKQECLLMCRIGKVWHEVWRDLLHLLP